MSRLRSLLVLTFLLLLSDAPRVMAIPADLSAPAHTFGYADRVGAFLYNLEIRDIDFGDGVKLPLRFTFHANELGDSAYGWTGWTVAALEASAAPLRPDLMKVMLLCGKELYFTNPAPTTSPVIPGYAFPMAEGSFTSMDGEWTGIFRSDGAFEITRWDGWRLVFRNGLIESLKTDGNRELRWARDGAGHRVTRIYDAVSNEAGLEVTYAGNGTPGEITVNGDVYTLSYADDHLSAIGLPDGTDYELGWQEVGAPGVDLKIQWSITDRYQVTDTFKFKAVNGTLLSDGVWNYTIGTPSNGIVIVSGSIAYDRPAMSRTRIATGETESVGYEAANSIATRTEASGLVVKNYMFKNPGRTYDKLRKIEHVWQGTTTTVYQAVYDEMTGKLVRTLDGKSHATEYAYESFAGTSEFAPPAKVTVTNALGHSTVSDYDVNGGLVKVTDPTGVERSFVYDTRHRLSEAKNDAGQTIAEFTWNNDDRVLTSKDALGNVTHFQYEAHHGRSLIKKIISPSGKVTQFDYDDKANIIQLTDQSGSTTHLTYNNRNLLESATNAMGFQASFAYDPRGNKTQVTDTLGFTSTADYDDLDLPKELVDALGFTSSYAWNATGQIKSVVDNRGNATQFQYFRDGQLERRIAADATESSNNYDATGNLIQVKPRGGQAALTFARDVLNHISQKNWDNGAGASGQSTYTYNSAGRMVASTTTPPSGTPVIQSWNYNEEGQVSTFTQNGRTVAYGRDGNHRLVSLTYPAGFAVTYTFNADGRVSLITNGGAPIASYAYDSAGRLASRTLANGVVTNYAYDVLSRVTSIQVSHNGATLWSHTYGYNARGDRMWTQFADGKGDAYQYDGSGRLTGVKYGAGNPSAGYAAAASPEVAASYAYDPAGNRTQSNEGESIVAHTTNAVNQYTLLAGAAGNQNPIYNGRGDLTAFGNWTFAYDGQGHLIQATDGTTQVADTYDGLGNRVAQNIQSHTTWHLTSGTELLEVYDVGSASAESYIHEPNINSPLASVSSSGAVNYYHQDILGNVIAVTDAAGNLVEEYRYDAWGRARVFQNGTPQPFGTTPRSRFLLTGHQYQPQTGLYYCRARTYAPALGRWMSEDPIAERGGLNLYAYVENNPVGAWDLMGLQPPNFNDAPGNKTPFTGPPDSTTRGGTGSRTYGPDGYPKTDRDYPHPDEKPPGSGDHSHDWSRPEGGKPPTHENRGSPRDPVRGDPPKPRGPNVPPPSAGPTALETLLNILKLLGRFPIFILDPCITDPYLPGCPPCGPGGPVAGSPPDSKADAKRIEKFADIGPESIKESALDRWRSYSLTQGRLALD